MRGIGTWAVRGLPRRRAHDSSVRAHLSTAGAHGRPRMYMGRALGVGAGICGGSALGAYLLERSCRFPEDTGAVPQIVAAVRFTRTLAVSVRVMLEYRILFAKYDDYTSKEYKDARSLQHSRSANLLLNLCKTQGAVYVKVGQHVASMSQAVPREYTSIMKQLEDRAQYRPFSQVRRVVERELGGRVSDHFRVLDRTPIAAASLAQVHVGETTSTGERVAVKVQYPGLETLVEGDLKSIQFMSRLLTRVFPYMSLDWMVDEFRRNLSHELDFVEEGRSCERTGAFFEKDPHISVPYIYPELSTKRILTMEYIDGFRVDDVGKLENAGIDPARVAETVVDAFGKMVFVSGFVHCDGHSGNLMVRPQPGSRHGFDLVLLDHGLYRELSDDFRVAYCRMWRGLVLRNSKDVEKACEDLGVPGYSNVFSIFLLNRGWSSVKNIGVDIRNKMTKEEMRELMREMRNEGIASGADATSYFKDVPQELLLVFKMNSLVRNINKALGAKVDRLRMNARIAVKGLHRRSYDCVSDRSAIRSDCTTEPAILAGKVVDSDRSLVDRISWWINFGVLDAVAELVDRAVVEANLLALDLALVLYRWFSSWADAAIVRSAGADTMG